jgi:DNA ligase-1
MVQRAVAWGVGKTVVEVEKMYKAKGDLGVVVGEIKSLNHYQIKPFEIQEVFEELTRIARDSGKGSQERKIEKLGKLLKEVDSQSAKYVVRLIMGKLRLGFSDLTILDSLSWAQTGGKTDRDELERAYNVWSDMGEVARLYKERGVVGLQSLDVVPGRPVKPMRAERLGTIPEIVEKLGEFAVEPKFDGMRVQVHAFKRESDYTIKPLNQIAIKQEGFFEDTNEMVVVKIFSRGLEDITAMFPDVVAGGIELHKNVGDFVVDGEALGVNLETGEFLPFQETMKRKRKYDIGKTSGEIPLSVQLFDVLYTAGAGRLSETYGERRERLENLMHKRTNAKIFCLAESTKVTEVNTAQKLFDEYMGKNLEGMLCKRLDSHYQAGARNFNWVKYKRAHEEDLVDTIDAVVMGYYVGRGKRQKFGVGAFLVGVLDGEKLLTVAKIGTGLTDEQFGELYTRMQKCKSAKMPTEYEVPKALIPDVWVEPRVIVEIQADEITKSPIHSAGYALRFPRLVKFRDDKQLSDITTKNEVVRSFLV